MTRMDTRPAATTAAAPVGGQTARTSGAPLPEARSHEQILLDHDWITADDLRRARQMSQARGVTVMDVLEDLGLYSGAEMRQCIATDEWSRRTAIDHHEWLTSPQRLEEYARQYREDGCFVIPNFLDHAHFRALDLSLHRLMIEHVDADPARHKVYHCIQSGLLYQHRPLTDVLGHPTMLRIAQNLLSDDLVQGRLYLRVNDPYQCIGMFPHTHAEPCWRSMNACVYMFIYMDTVSHESGAIQYLPGSHRRYGPGPGGETYFDGQPIPPREPGAYSPSITHDPDLARRWAGYQSINMPGNSLLVFSPLLWHGVRPLHHRRRIIFTGFFDAPQLTRPFIERSEYFGDYPYAMRDCDLSRLTDRQRELLGPALDPQGWMKRRGV